MARKYQVYYRDGVPRPSVWVNDPPEHITIVDEAEFDRLCPNVRSAWKLRHGSPDMPPPPPEEPGDPFTDKPKRGRPRKPLEGSQ